MPKSSQFAPRGLPTTSEAGPAARFYKWVTCWDFLRGKETPVGVSSALPSSGGGCGEGGQVMEG